MSVLIANRIIHTEFNCSSLTSFLPCGLLADLDDSRPILITIRWRDQLFSCLQRFQLSDSEQGSKVHGDNFLVS